MSYSMCGIVTLLQTPCHRDSHCHGSLDNDVYHSSPVSQSYYCLVFFLIAKNQTRHFAGKVHEEQKKTDHRFPRTEGALLQEALKLVWTSEFQPLTPLRRSYYTQCQNAGRDRWCITKTWKTTTTTRCCMSDCGDIEYGIKSIRSGESALHSVETNIVG